EEAWNSAAVMEGFTVIDGSYPVDQTSARMAYDDTNVYILIINHQRVLDPALQKLDEFRATITKHDDHVYQDDSVEVFISPDGDRSMQFVLNALGTRFESAGGDVSWNGQWDAACKVNDGNWIAEIRIPWATLPKECRNGFKFNICRTQVADSQYSAWSPPEVSFSNAARFATCRLADKPVSVRAPGMMESLLAQSLTQLSIIADAGGSKYTLAVDIASEGAELHKPMRDTSAKGNHSFALMFAKGSRHRVQYSASDTDGEVIFRSPAYFVTRRMDQSASVSLTAGELMSVLLNGKRQANHEAILLQPGLNEITIECIRPADGGEIQGQLRAAAGAGTPEVVLPIDERWPSKPCKDAQSVVMSGRIAVATSQFHPVARDNTLYIARGLAQHAPFIVVNPTREVSQITVQIDLPPELELVGIDRLIRESKGNYPKNGKILATRAVESGITGRKRYEFEFENVQPFSEWFNHIHALVFKTASEAPGPFNVYYRMEGSNQSGPFAETWNTLKVIPLEIPAARRPERLRTTLWHGFRTGGYNAEETNALVKTFADVGFNSYIDRTSAHDRPEIRSNLLNALYENNFYVIMEISPAFFLGRMAGANPAQASVDFNGKRPHHLPLRPGFMLNDGADEIRKHITHIMKATGAPASLWDLEFPPFSTCDVSEATLKEFAAFARLSKTPTAEELKTTYRKQWIDFMCNVWAGLARIYKEGTKAAGADLATWLYSSYPGESFKERYGIDWSLMKGHVDVAAMGYATPTVEQLSTIRAINATSNCGVLYFEDSTPDQYRLLKTSMIRRVAQGGDGVSLFTWVLLDGRAYGLLAQAFGLMADHEDFFLDGRRVKPVVRGKAPVDNIYVMQLGQRRLVVAINESTKPTSAAIDLGKLCRVRDYYTGAESRVRTLQIQVPSCDVKAYEVDFPSK
ncbi:MAG: hypothetical protein GXY38_12960, partial [Planctomycetes bacterium]|nr:hypothetical protein [Planctomycetota bacterium]